MKSGRITADMRFAPWLEAHPNCSLRSQLLISANVIGSHSCLFVMLSCRVKHLSCILMFQCRELGRIPFCKLPIG